MIKVGNAIIILKFVFKIIPMKTANFSTILLLALLIMSCQTEKLVNMPVMDDSSISEVISSLKEKYPDVSALRIERGVGQAAAFWNAKDGPVEEFREFCFANFVASNEKKQVLFEKLSRNFELINGYFHQMNRSLNEPLHLDTGPISDIDVIFGSYSPSAHLTEDLYKNKIAFIALLNFPFYSLDEKNDLGKDWSRQEWAYARMADNFTTRIPSEILQKASEVSTESDNYIAGYNIMMGSLLNENGQTLFPEEMKLITHWGLRDEIKSNYGQDGGLEKQMIIYEVMKRIIDQSIPEKVINNAEFQWNPYSNKVFTNGNASDFSPEPDTRYAYLLNNFKSMRDIDAYSPYYPDYISRTFKQNMEISQLQIEELFKKLVSSPQTAMVAEMIRERLGRELQPFDIWYDGFKPRSSFSPEKLDEVVNKKYPSKDAFENDIPNILIKLGFDRDKAMEISSRITVDAARGAGHAWGAVMKGDKAHLRTRVGKDGMDYKGYNIAVHELGHNVEQTITLYDIDYYMLNGVPNTGFTEAMAFIFQTKDMDFLGMKSDDPKQKHLKNLDLFWGVYEIMGVSLVDMEVWKWMYQNSDVDKAQLKEKVIEIAIDVWNKYYAPVFGISDQPILAIYSHMISYPLYLSAYPLGHLIEFQVEDYIGNKNIAKEIHRMLVAGRVTPQEWMKLAVGGEISVEPMLKAVDNAVQTSINFTAFDSAAFDSAQAAAF
jgi:hypothetical protein